MATNLVHPTYDKQLQEINNSKIPHPFNSADILHFLLALVIVGVCAALTAILINTIAHRQYLRQRAISLKSDPFDAVVKEIYDLLFTYHRMAVILHSIYIFLGASTILSSVFVTTFLNSNATMDGVPIATYLPLISFASTASISLISAFSLGNKANNSRRAWRVLSTALDRYRTSNPENKTRHMEELLIKKAEAETIVGAVDFKY